MVKHIKNSLLIVIGIIVGIIIASNSAYFANFNFKHTPAPCVLVDKYIAKNLDKTIISSGGILPYKGITPSLVKDKQFATNRRIITGVYTDQYDFDTHFMSKTLLAVDAKKYAPVVKDAMLNFLALQSPEGFIPRTIGYDGIKDFPGHHKPFLFQTVLLLYSAGISPDWLQQNYAGYNWQKSFVELNKTKDDPAHWTMQKYQTFLQPAEFKPIDRLEKYLQFYDHFRKVPGRDLYAWTNIVESGIDTTLALWPRIYAPEGDVELIRSNPAPSIATVDLNVYLYNEFKAAAKVFALLGNTQKNQYYLGKAAKIQKQFLTTFWDNKTGFFYNRFFEKNGASEIINIPAWMGILPLASPGLIDNKRRPQIAKRIIENQLLAKDAFMTPFGIRSLSRRSPVQGGDSPRALVPGYEFEAANWNNPVWILPNIYAVQILQQYGYKPEAKLLLAKINLLLASDIKNENMMHEQYSYLDGKPGWAENFMSWNTLLLLLNKNKCVN